jgi:hypothetical protein
MRLVSLVVVGALAVCLAPKPASAQSLAEIAAKEKERRKGAGGKVITESDLQRAGHGLPAGETEVGSDAEAPAEGEATEGTAAGQSAPKEKTEEEQRAERQASLQKEIDAERAHIEEIKKDLALRQAELNDLTNYTFGGRRADLIKYVEDAKQAIVTHEGQIEKLMDEARRKGIRVQ